MKKSKERIKGEKIIKLKTRLILSTFLLICFTTSIATLVSGVIFNDPGGGALLIDIYPYHADTQTGVY